MNLIQQALFTKVKNVSICKIYFLYNFNPFNAFL